VTAERYTDFSTSFLKREISRACAGSIEKPSWVHHLMIAEYTRSREVPTACGENNRSASRLFRAPRVSALFRSLIREHAASEISSMESQTIIPDSFR